MNQDEIQRRLAVVFNDVFEDADGSLIVIDTGGWYKLCCPTSQLAKPDVLGAIYRGAHHKRLPLNCFCSDFQAANFMNSADPP